MHPHLQGSEVSPGATARPRRVRAWRVALASLALMTCASPAHPGDAGPADAPIAEAQVGAPRLGDRVEAVMAPAFAATPASLEQCVGGVAIVVTPTEEHVGGWGATTLGGGVVPTETTLFQIGSLTKVFTGIAMARRVEEGDLSPDTSAGALLAPDLRDAVPAWPTMAALISHHAGLPNFPPNLVDRDGDGARDPGIDPRSPADGYGRADLRAGLASWSPPAAPSYLYSNLGVGVAALALQDRLGASGYDATLRPLITQDLGMDDTWGEIAAVPASARARLAGGHVAVGASRVPGILASMGVLAGSGGIVTSARDMRVWLRALLGLDRTVLAAAIARATTPLTEGPDGRRMGYAIEIDDRGGTVRYRKVGTTASFTAYLTWSTTPPVGVAVLTNCGGFRRAESLAEALADVAR